MSNWLGIEGKVVVVTGGSSGIGESVVEGLIEAGVKVANFDIAENDINHENYFFAKVDVTSRESVETGVKKTLERFGSLDGVVNNAGINIPALLVDTKQSHSQYELNDAIFDKMIAINQKGLYIVAQAVGRVLAQNKNGVIINMGSESGLEGSEGQSCYAATKAATYSFTRSWAKELGKSNVRVVGLAPGIMEETGLRTIAYEEALAYTRNISVEQLREGYNKTSTIPLGRSGKLTEVADAVCYLLSDKSSYITGVTINVAGGKTRG